MWLPDTLVQAFTGAKSFLVLHLGAGPNPIAQVNIRKTQFKGLVDLPKHTIGAIAAMVFGIVKSINSRQTIVQDINDADHFELAWLTMKVRLTKLYQPELTRL